ncbi:hypothetical protein UQW22_08700 [Isoptericola halotolerans]|uniref:hypothetical protein n=1 Tax=Isoptericola halotolerans TaxID=300560 RepID=UPI00388E8993
MQARSVAGEAARNLVTGTTRALWWALAFVVLVGGLAVADARVLVRVWQDADAFRSAGAAVQTLASEREQVVDGTRCQALSGVAGLTGAGALRPGAPVRAASMPSSDLTVWEVTPGVLDLLTTTARPVRTATGTTTGGLWLADDLAAALGASAGDELVIDDGRVRVAGVYTWPDDGRDRVLAYAAVVAVPATGTFERCWAGAWPVDDDAAGLLYSATSPGADDLRLGQLNSTRGSGYDLSGLVDARPTAVAPAAAAAVGLVLGYLAVRTRRLELASALHARVPKPFLTWQHLLEAGCWLAAALSVTAAATGVAALVGSPGPYLGTWATAGMAAGTGAAATLIGTLVGVLTTREKHLFRYFKER